MQQNAVKNVFDIRPWERVSAFIDGAHLDSVCHQLDFYPDFATIVELLDYHGHLVRPYFYSSFDPDKEDAPERRLFDFLDYHGFKMCLKEARIIQDPATGRRKIRASIAVELACDMNQAVEHSDHMVVFAGNGDFERPIRDVQKKGVRVTVVSSLKVERSAVFDGLRRAADQFIDLDSFAEIIDRNPETIPPPRTGPRLVHSSTPAPTQLRHA